MNPRFMTWIILLLLGWSATLGTLESHAAAWEPLGLSGGGGMFAPSISPLDPNLMLVNCDMSAAYLSRDGGQNWRMLHHDQLRSDTRCRAAFHPANREIIYASSGGQLRVSRDGGQTFARIGDLKENLGGEIAINPADPRVMLAGTWNGRCYISRNGGSNWMVCTGPAGGVLGFHFDRTRGGQTMLAATREGIWRSDDSGTSWVEKTSGLPWKKIQGFAGGSVAGGDLVVLYCSIESKAEQGVYEGGVYSSRDRGETWRPAMGAGINKETSKADEYAHGPVAQYHQLLSSDAKPLTVYAMNTSTGFHPPHHETVYRSDDGGQSWRDTWFIDPRFKQCNVAPDYVVASTGQSFKGGEAPFGVAICSSDPERLIVVRSQCQITHDGGRSWFRGDTRPAPGEKPRPGSAWICNGLVVTTTWNYYIDPFEPNRHYIAYTDIGWARSLDAGQSWIWWDKSTWAQWRNTCYEIAFDPKVPGRMWGAFSDVHDIPNDNIISERHGHHRPGGVCVSQDFGARWKKAGSGLPARAVTSIVLDPESPAEARTLYAGVFEEGIYKSGDGGASWVVKKKGLGDPSNLRVSRVILHKDRTMFAMICARREAGGKPLLPEGVGLYRSKDQAESWEMINRSRLLLYPKDFSVDPRDSRHILIGACDAGRGDQSGGLYRTRDGGVSWERIGRKGSQTFGGYFHPSQRDWLYMTLTEGAPGAGLWLSRDDGRSWEAFDELPFANIQRLTFDPGDAQRLYVSTFGGSIWRGPTTPAAK